MIPRVINNVCFNVNLRLGSNLISTEATRSNADGDWLGGTHRGRICFVPERRTRAGERRSEEEPSGEEEVEETTREEGNAEERRREGKKEEEEEEDEQEEPLGIVRGRSLVTRDSCDPDDP